MDPYTLNPSRPFDGLRIALPDTERSARAAGLAERLGASVVRFRLSSHVGDPERRGIEHWVNELLGGAFDDVVFSTAQGVHVLLGYGRCRHDEEATIEALARARCIARGPQVAAALDGHGIEVDIRSDDATSASLLAALAGLDFSKRTVALQLFARNRETVLREHLREAGASLRTLASSTDEDAPTIELIELIEHGRLDAVLFTSSTQIDRVLGVAKECGRIQSLRRGFDATRVVAVGAAAAESLRENAVRVDALVSRRVLDEPDRELLAESLDRDVRPVDAPRPATDSARSSRRRTVVVIGNGMVSHRFCERIVDYDDDGSIQLVVLGDEPLPAYDRVNLTSYLDKKSADELLLAEPDWYAAHGIDLRLGRRAVSIDRDLRLVETDDGEAVRYDALVLATGSEPFVPPVPGMNLDGVFVYRTIADLDAIRTRARTATRAAVIGGGLLGLEAAKAVRDLGVETHVVEFASRLMPRQLDELGGQLLARVVENLGVHVHVEKATKKAKGDRAVEGLVFADGPDLDIDMVVVSAGIRPRSDLADRAGLRVGERGGVVVGDDLRTDDPRIYAIGECALHHGTTYGLVAPGYDMADTLAQTLTGSPSAFEGSDMSTKLKLLGVDVASLGKPFPDNPDQPTVVLQDLVNGVYKKLVLDDAGERLVGAMLVGDAKEYASLLHLVRSGEKVSGNLDALIVGDRDGGDDGGGLPAEAQICSCNNVTMGDLCRGIREQSLASLQDVQKHTSAGTGCGGCLPTVADILSAELIAQGHRVSRPALCEHFAYTRQELYEIVKVRRIADFDALLAEYGRGDGCEVCKPAVASILASTHNELITHHQTIQDTNDRFLANIQRRGLYSVIPRIPGGEITPDKLIALGTIAKKHGLYTKITGGQRVDLLGARLDQLPDIWEALVQEGFESGHAYGKAMRTVKSCVGSTWCRYGVQDSVSMALRVEGRYKGVRSPHKLKGAVSGCIRECAEAQSKDFGLIATERGYNVYVCGNGGTKPRHADLLAADVDADTAVRYLDRFLMYYIQTADKLTRTSVWLERLDGGIEYLKEVVVDDRLGICEQLELDMQHLVDTYQCEWAAVVSDPEQRARFHHFANSSETDGNIEFVVERGQLRPADWLRDDRSDHDVERRVSLPVLQTSWVRVGRVEDFPENGGRAIKYGATQVAVFNFESRDRWYATQNTCPHRLDQVLSRGIIGDAGGEPKVACPLHKKTFSLESGECLSGEPYRVRTFDVKVADGEVLVDLPPEHAMVSLVPHCPAPAKPPARATH